MAVPFPHGWKSRLFPTSLLDSVNILLAKSLYTIIIMLSESFLKLLLGLRSTPHFKVSNAAQDPRRKV